MISLQSISSASNASQYYGETYEYYKEDKQALIEAIYWTGKGAKALGLKGFVEKQDFSKLLQGQLPHGQQLGKHEAGEIKHRPGFDMTFSAPKSLSILALVGKDERLTAIHDESVKETLAYIETNIAETRVVSQGLVHFEKTNNLTTAVFRQETSREMDPHLHSHTITMNVTQGQDGKWRALASDLTRNKGTYENAWNYRNYFGLIYRSKLANKLENQGYSIQKTHPDGRFEIAGVPKHVIEHFSKRRQQIENLMNERGWQGPAAAQEATLLTRKSKTQANELAENSNWQQRLDKVNWDAKAFVNQQKQTANHNSLKQNSSKQKSTQIKPEAPAKDSKTIKPKQTSQQQTTKQSSQSHTKTNSITVWWQQKASDIYQRLFNPAKTEQNQQQNIEQQISQKHQNMLSFAANHLGEREAVFSDADLKTAAMQHNLGNCEPEKLQQAVEQCEAKGDLIAIPSETRELYWTTPQALKLEAQTVARIRAGENQLKPIAKRDTIRAHIRQSKIPYTPGQQNAIKTTLNTKNRIIGVQGYAGTGKTTMLTAVKQIAEKENYILKGMAPSAAAVKQLTNSTGIHSQTLSSMLIELKQSPQTDLSNTLFILDEASMASTKQMDELTQQIARHQTRLVLLGDSQQLPAIEAGKPFSLAQAFGMQTAKMQDILRQALPSGEANSLRKAVYALTEGEVAKAFNSINSVTEIDNKEERLIKIATNYLKCSASVRNNTLVLVPANEDRVIVNQLIRNGLQQDGSIQKKDISFNTLISRDLTATQQQFARYYQKNDVVRFNRSYREINIQAGQYVTVDKIDNYKNILYAHTEDNKKIRWSLTTSCWF